MSSDISKVYLFLSERPNWKTEMDTDKDGTILKAECRDFLTANFDWASLEGWNGESSKQTDLINDFWKSIDTTKTGDMTGTIFKNKNALDSNEITNMNNKIEMYEILNDYTSTLSAPSVISNSTGWKQIVKQNLTNLTETFIKNGGIKEDLLAYLESMSENIQNKATADYIADEYLNNELKDFMKEYDYSYLEDQTLQGIISNYIQNIPEGNSIEEIESTVKSIVNAYLATAGVKENNAFDLSAYGYTVDETTKLNDLQKTYLTKTLQTVLENVKNAMGYENNKELYDNAVNDFINKVLSDAKFNDFETIKNYTYEMFTNSEQYKEVSDVVTAKELLKGDNLYNRVASEINQSLADLIKNDGKYLKVIKNIETELITKVKSGEFSVEGNLDTNAMLDWVIEQIQNRIMEFYENGLSNIEVNELNAVYDMLYNVAINEADADKSKEAQQNAAIKYCEALISKNSDKLKEAVINEFGEDWKNGIKNMYPSEIYAAMTRLKTNALKIDEEERRQIEEKENNEKISSAAQNISDCANNVKYSSVSTIINGQSTIHTEFGIDANGNIVFQEESTTLVFNTLAQKVKEEIKKSKEGITALNNIGGESILNKIIQAAWISAYNTYNSSTSNSTANFVSTVLDNIKNIMEKLKEHPELIKAYTEHTSYTDTSLTNGLTHYNTNTTIGNDENIIYKGGATVDANGVVHLQNTKDDPDYQVTMDELLHRLINKYSYIAPDTITNIFRNAQQEAIQICINNEHDCPYGTNNGSARVEDNDSKRDWSGKDSRDDDNFKIHMDELVQLTLYCFDKLLYVSL